jgi:hypothetical protein
MDGDQKKDVFLAGNLTNTEVETTSLDAGKGLCLVATDTEWSILHQQQSGIMANGNVKGLCLLNVGKEKRPLIIVANNNGPLTSFLLNKMN